MFQQLLEQDSHQESDKCRRHLLEFRAKRRLSLGVTASPVTLSPADLTQPAEPSSITAPARLVRVDNKNKLSTASDEPKAAETHDTAGNKLTTLGSIHLSLRCRTVSVKPVHRMKQSCDSGTHIAKHGDED